MGIFAGTESFKPTPVTDKNELYRQYISEHVANVKKALSNNYDKLIKLFPDADFDKLKHEIKYHDNSKTSAYEFNAYRKRFFPEDGEEYNPDEFEKAWLHHIHSNPHHWNYWVLADRDKGESNFKALEMPDEYLIEMILDWTAMGYKFGDSALSYYNKVKDTIVLHPDTRKKLEVALQAMFGKD